MEIDEVFYSLSNEDILRHAKLMRISRKKFMPEVMQKIKRMIKDEIKEYVNDVVQEAISDAVHEKEAAYE